MISLADPIEGDDVPKLPWICRATDGSGSIEVFKNEKVWVRVPSPFEKKLAPGTPKKGKHDHRWREVLNRTRTCVRGLRTRRGPEQVGKPWRYKSGKR